jgi:glycosyltransferase involved in cell wall biosynthesis
MNEMKILMTTGIFSPDIGGPATYVPAMSSELVKRGHKVGVVTLSDTLNHDDRSYVFHVHRIRRSLFKPLRFLLTVLRIFQLGRHVQLLYVNGLFLEAVVANFFLRKPLVQKIVGDWAWERATNKGWVADGFEDFQERRHSLKIELLKTLRRFCAHRADAVIVPSQYVGRALTGWGVADSRTIVIYNAVEPRSSPRATIPLSTRFNLVTASRLIALKQIDQLIESLIECSDVGLVIVGDGPERGRLEELVRTRRLVDRVYFAGQRTRDDTLELMAACDVFVLNSTHEGFPHVVLEAMNVGLPVIATAVGGTPELVRHGKNGLLISPNANGALLVALSKLLSSSEEREKLAAGAQNTSRRFQWSAMIDNTEAILKECSIPKHTMIKFGTSCYGQAAKERSRSTKNLAQ